MCSLNLLGSFRMYVMSDILYQCIESPFVLLGRDLCFYTYALCLTGVLVKESQEDI